jgi:type II secretory pathway pseudopilin PulG
MRPRRSGYSLLEIVIVLAITVVILIATFMVIFAITRGNESLTPRVQLQLEATRVLREMCALLKTSGPTEIIVAGTTPPKGNGTWDPGEYPAFASYLPLPGLVKWAPPYDFLNVNNTSITPNAPTTDTDIYPVNKATGVSLFGGNQTVEIAFRVPKTTEVTKPYPTDPTTGAVEWGTDILAIVLVPGAYGNELQMRWYDALTQALVRRTVLTRDVERIVFQCSNQSFYAGCPAMATNIDATLTPQSDEMKVTLFFWKTDPNGKIVKLSQSSSFNFRSISR